MVRKKLGCPINGPARVLDAKFMKSVEVYMNSFNVVTRWQKQGSNRIYLRLSGTGGAEALTLTLVHLNNIMPRMIRHMHSVKPNGHWEEVLWVGIGTMELDYSTFLREEAKRSRSHKQKNYGLIKPIIIES